MKRKLVCLIACLLLLPALLGTAAADTPLVIDNAELLTAEEERALEEQSRALQETYNIDAGILTVNTLDGKRPQDYADDYYDNNGYSDDGVLFLISMEQRDWYISTSGEVIYALPDYGIQQLGEQAVSYLSYGDYYGAFEDFLTSLPDYISAYLSGTPIDGYADTSGDYYHGDREETVYAPQPRRVNLWISLAVGIVVGAVVVLVMRASMNTKRPQRSAEEYLRGGSYHLRTQRDMFLYSHVSKVKIETNSGGSGGGGGGSSVHHSSSGRSHGGGGGKF